MTSKKIIERLLHQDWFVKCETEHEVALVLNACIDAKISWSHGASASCLPDLMLLKKPLFIEQNTEYGCGLRWDDLEPFRISKNCEDITDWFFEELRK
ncbi:hypothetical protein [Gilliamella sp. Bif1-4]|uniref:hypothetical protein n=1 Tax=Gilliamella sp. Bif1-4 TaxID=3120233 RepID=UPI00080DF335|nr:hypothetical protein [Gilliamella apicola]OCG39757.1 hypothetical protein A9G25_10155 [Gilliamella apicola]